MNAASLVGLVLTIFLSLAGCSTTQVPPESSRVISDRHGVISITLPGDWYDDTDNFVRQVERVRKSNPPDPGVRSLLMLKQRGDQVFCGFRTFRYRRNEQGFHWDAKRIAEEVTNHNNASHMKHGFSDYFNKGVPTTPFQTKAKKIELEESSVFQVQQNSGWQMVFGLWFENSGMNRELSVTTVIPYAIADSNQPKYYLVAECAIHERGSLLQQRRREIMDMLKTMKFAGETYLSSQR